MPHHVSAPSQEFLRIRQTRPVEEEQAHPAWKYRNRKYHVATSFARREPNRQRVVIVVDQFGRTRHVRAHRPQDRARGLLDFRRELCQKALQPGLWRFKLHERSVYSMSAIDAPPV